MCSLTSRERVARMLDGRDHDRVPRHDGFWRETILRWQGEGLRGGEKKVWELLGNDLERIGRSDPVPYPGQEQMVRDDGPTCEVIDRFGARTRIWKDRSGPPTHLGWECTDPDVWRSCLRPRMEQHGLFLDIEAARTAWQRAAQAHRWTCFWCTETFEFALRLMGFEALLTAMAAEPDWVREISQFRTDLLLRDFNAALAAGVRPDGLWIYGDLAFVTGPFCSPPMYRELIWPDHRQLCDWAHAHQMKVIYHTDGDVRMVLDLLLAAGVDGLQPLEAKAHMDVRRLASSYGNRLAFFGNIDVRILASGDLQAIEEEVRSKLLAGKATRRYMYHSDHSVPPNVSWQTYLLLIVLLDRYGAYC